MRGTFYQFVIRGGWIMSPVAAFIIGLLVGWIIEWIIDWLYWRRRSVAQPAEPDLSSRMRVAELEQELASYRNQIASLQAEKDRAEAMPAVERSLPVVESAPARDRLEDIAGVTPEIARSLNAAGIYTFADLGALPPQRLRETLGEGLLQTGGEVEIVKQARLTSGMIRKVDDLEVIVGIGPVIARHLNAAGIFTFAELGELTAADLRGIVGTRIEKLADEEQILSQARQLAEAQSRGG
jgi:predicted flap endonuclease-1-like 5' DNA nuclease